MVITDQCSGQLIFPKSELVKIEAFGDLCVTNYWKNVI